MYGVTAYWQVNVERNFCAFVLGYWPVLGYRYRQVTVECRHTWAHSHVRYYILVQRRAGLVWMGETNGGRLMCRIYYSLVYI